MAEPISVLCVRCKTQVDIPLTLGVVTTHRTCPKCKTLLNITTTVEVKEVRCQVESALESQGAAATKQATKSVLTPNQRVLIDMGDSADPVVRTLRSEQTTWSASGARRVANSITNDVIRVFDEMIERGLHLTATHAQILRDIQRKLGPRAKSTTIRYALAAYRSDTKAMLIRDFEKLPRRRRG